MGIDENINIGRELQERIAELEAEVERLKTLLPRTGAELYAEVERLHSALDAIISRLRREGCTSRGCDQGIHTMQCPMEIAVLLEQALKG
jgi:uncharacterized small protein (DUF1192 family)